MCSDYELDFKSQLHYLPVVCDAGQGTFIGYFITVISLVMNRNVNV